MRIRISLKNGQEVHSGELKKFPFVIGRRLPADLVVAANGVSGQHLEITQENDRIFVRDLGSRNGTFLSEEKISFKPISLPAKIRLGQNVLVELSKEPLVKPELAEAIPPERNNVDLPRPSSPHSRKKPARPSFGSTLWHFFGHLPDIMLVAYAIGVLLALTLLFWGSSEQGLLWACAKSLGVGALVMASSFLMGGFRFLLKAEHSLRSLFSFYLLLSLLVAVPLTLLPQMMVAEESATMAKQWLNFLLVPLCLFLGYLLFFSVLGPKVKKRWILCGLCLGSFFAFGATQWVQGFSRESELYAIFLRKEAPARLATGAPISALEMADRIRALETSRNNPNP